MRSFAVVVAVALALIAPACGPPPEPSAPSRAAVPANAAASSYTFRRGVILHHWLAMPFERVRGKSDVPHSYAARWFDEEDVAWIAEHGFDHIVFVIEDELWLRADGSFDESKIAPFEAALAWCRKHKLGAIARVSMSPVRDPDTSTSTSDAKRLAPRAQRWRHIAQRFATAGDELRFLPTGAIIGDGVDLAAVNDAMREFVTGVRAVSRDRFLYVSAAIHHDSSFIADPDTSFAQLDQMWLPDDPRVGVAVVYSEPEAFTWQVDPKVSPLRFPGATATAVHTRIEIEDDFARFATWKRGRGAGRESYLSYIGMHDPADAISTRTYMAAVTDLAARHDLGWAVYDYESAYAIRGADGKPTPLYDGLGLRKRSEPPVPAFTYDRGVLIAHWIGGVAPRYEGESKMPHSYAAPWFDGEDIRWLADHGFDHVQIPVDAREWRPDLPEAKLAPLARVLTLANAAGLGVVLMYDADQAEPIDRVAREWGAIATRFAAIGDGLRFHAGLGDAAENPGPRFRAYVTAIRASSPRRFIYLPVPLGEPLDGQLTLDGTAERNRAHVRSLELDKLDAQVGVAFEYWEPRVFSFQFRMKAAIPLPGVVPDFRNGAVAPGSYGGADEYNAIAAAASGKAITLEAITDDLTGVFAAVAAEAPGRTVYLSRFGMVRGQDPIATRRYLSIIVGAARALGMGWSVYDYESGRAIRNGDGTPAPGYEGLGLVPRSKPVATTPS